MTDDDRTDRTDPPNERGRPNGAPGRLGRRDLLRLGAVGAAAAIAGCSGGDGDDTDPSTDRATEDGDDPDGEPPRQRRESIPYAGEYETVVDVVADGGADPQAGESIIPVLEAEAGDDTLLYFPPGEYLMDDGWLFPEFEHLGVVGEGATIVPQRGYFGYLFVFGLPDRTTSDLLFEGIDFDFTANDTAPRPLQVQIDDGITVRDVTVSGIGGTARFDATSPNGEGVIEGLEMPDGGREPNPVGILVGPANRGRLRFDDCHIEGFPGNGLYASPSNGPIEVVGGLYANNGIASVRVSSPATVRDVTVRCNEAPNGFRNMRGIRLRHGESILVENCTVEMTDLSYSDGAVVVEPMMQSATIRDVDIELSVDEVPAVNARSPQDSEGTSSIVCERVDVTGDAARGAAVKIVDRDTCDLRTMDIQQSGAERDGLHLIRSVQSILRDSEIDVTGDPIVLDESQVQQVDNQL